MQQEEKKALVFEMANTLLQSWWTVVAGVCLGLTGAVVALSMTESVFMSTAKIYVTPEISKELGRPIIADDMTRRMAAMQDAVLSKDHLQRMSDKLYGPAPSPDRLESRIRRIRRAVEVTPTAVATATTDGLYAFDLTFYDTDAERAARAANLLAEAYIDQNSEFRTKQAQEAADAAQKQADLAKKELDTADRELIEFRERHLVETEGHQDANLRQMERRQTELEKNGETRRELEGRIENLQKRQSELRGGGTDGANEVLRLRRELDDLLTQYSEAHPRVIQLRRRLDDAIAALEAPPVGPDGHSSAYPQNPEIAVLQDQIDDTRKEIGVLQRRQDAIREEIAEYERRVAAVSQIQPELSRLETEAATLRQRYQKLQGIADQTKQALFLEKELRGERFELAERAEVRYARIYPEPMRFYAVGMAAGCLLFVGPLFAWRFLNPMVSSEAGLRALSDVPVLVAIPRIETPATRGYRFRRNVKNLALSTLSTAVLVAAFMLTG